MSKDNHEDYLADSVHMTRKCRHLTMSMAVSSIVFYVMMTTGCAHNHSLQVNAQTARPIQTSATHEIRPSSKSNLSQSQILSELMIIFLDAHVLETTQPIKNPSTGPQLIAGDWLAWQCAAAGNYWDQQIKNAPANTEAFDTN